MRILEKYLQKCNGKFNPAMVSYIANLEQIIAYAPDIASYIVDELETQRAHLKLVASENYCSLNVQAAMGNLLTDKYAEGSPGHRYYGGCENVDKIELAACEAAKDLFGAEHAYVQPHSGCDANLIAYWAILSKRIEADVLEHAKIKNVSDMTDTMWEALRVSLGNQKLMGLDYYSGGHLTHGYRMNVSAKMFHSVPYTVNTDTGLLDYDAIEEQAMKERPLILLAGFSAYPRKINFKRFREIADKCGATLMVDMAHFSGLVAGKVFTDEYDPVKWADIVTTTTHKTLRGPRGALILCKKDYAPFVDKGCPMVQGGPLNHIIAAKAIAFREAKTDNFKQYANQVVKNAQALADACQNLDMRVQTGGTDNHLMLINVTSYGLTGKQAEAALFQCGITVNANSLPADPNGPWWTSGIRVGTPALTTLGFTEDEMPEVAALIDYVLSNAKPELTSNWKPSKGRVTIDDNVILEAQCKVKELLSQHVLYPQLDLEFLKENFSLAD